MFDIAKLAKRLRSQKGFTLVELMVVVVIIGILVAIAIPIYNNVTANAREKACAANIRALTGAAGMYLAEQGNYPGEIDDLAPNYIDEVPVCPVDEKAGYSIDEKGVVTCDHDTAVDPEEEGQGTDN